MVRMNKPPSHVSIKIRKNVAYAPKASCFVLAPQDRMNLAQFCALLMTVERQLKNKKNGTHDEVQQKSDIKIIRLRKSKNSFAGQEGSRNCEPFFIFKYQNQYLFNSFSSKGFNVSRKE
jgi:hypothetical protein